MEAQHNLAKWVREVEAGRELAITRRKKIVARLAPPKAADAVDLPDAADRG
jgi:antitoxin (DNA-binding transcriptional repressor) of toxin-antitoxin stability system